jgi:hypothetical protein
MARRRAASSPTLRLLIKSFVLWLSANATAAAKTTPGTTPAKKILDIFASLYVLGRPAAAISRGRIDLRGVLHIIPVDSKREFSVATGADDALSRGDGAGSMCSIRKGQVGKR